MLYLKKKNTFLFLFFVSVFVFSCSKSTYKFSGVRLTWYMPIVQDGVDSIIKLEGKNDIFFVDSLVIYKKEDVFIKDDNSEIPLFTYWIYEKNNKIGLKYEYLDRNASGIVFNVDSFQLRNECKSLDDYGINEPNLIFLSQKKINKNIVVDKYFQKVKPDNSYPDTILYYFDKRLNYIPFSFSNKIDNIRKSKLVRLLAKYNGIKNSKTNTISSSFKFEIEIKDLGKLDSIIVEELNYFKTKYHKEYQSKTLVN